MGLLHHTVMYEVDFPNVARQKATLIKTTKELSALVGDTEGERLGMILLEHVVDAKCSRRNKQSFSLLNVSHDGRGTRKLYMFIFWVKKKKKGNKETICKHWEITRRCVADNEFVKSSVSFCDIF